MLNRVVFQLVVTQAPRLVPVEVGAQKNILLNLLTGAVDIITEEERKALWEGIASQPLYKYMEKRGHIFPTTEAEEDFLSRLLDKFQATPQRLFFSFILTYDCNFRCTYCYQSHQFKKPELTLKEKDIDCLIDSLDHVIERHNLHSGKGYSKKIDGQLYGGEPFLPANKGLLEKFLSRITERGYPINMVVTNGYNIAEFIDLLSEYEITQIQVTLDGPREIHDLRRITFSGEGTFDRIIENIDTLLDYGRIVNLRVNVDKQNIPMIPELARIIRKKWEPNLVRHQIKPVLHLTYGSKYSFSLGADEVLGIAMVLKLMADQEDMRMFDLFHPGFNEILQLFKESLNPPCVSHCGAYNNLYVFDPMGRIYPCSGLLGTEHYIGTAYPVFSISEKKFKLWRERNIKNFGKCYSCKFSLICGTGCVYRPFLIGHSPYISDCLLPFSELIPLYVQFFYKMRSKYPLYPESKFS